MSLSGFSLPAGPLWGLGVLPKGLEAPERSGILENPWGPSRGLGSFRGVAAPRRGLGNAQILAGEVRGPAGAQGGDVGPAEARRPLRGLRRVEGPGGTLRGGARPRGSGGPRGGPGSQNWRQHSWNLQVSTRLWVHPIEFILQT